MDEAGLERLDVLVHNAGAMPETRTESAQGHEMTMALHLLGPVLMTDLLRPVLAGHDARVVFVTSGGMYGQRLRADDPAYVRGEYSPTTAYARSKRAQVELLPVLARRWAPEGVVVGATHPGWADTPGIETSLPTFHRLIGPLLRDAEGGVDTTVWLAATEPAPEADCSGTTGAIGPRTCSARPAPATPSATRCGTGAAREKAARRFRGLSR